MASWPWHTGREIWCHLAGVGEGELTDVDQRPRQRPANQPRCAATGTRHTSHTWHTQTSHIVLPLAHDTQHTSHTWHTQTSHIVLPLTHGTPQIRDTLKPATLCCHWHTAHLTYMTHSNLNHHVAGAVPQTHWGILHCSPNPTAGEEGTSPPKESRPSRLSSFAVWPFRPRHSDGPPQCCRRVGAYKFCSKYASCLLSICKSISSGSRKIPN